MSDEVQELRTIAWRGIFPWLCLLDCFRQAIRLRVLLLAMLGMLAATTGWRVIGDAFKGSTHLQQADDARLIKKGGHADLIPLYRKWPWEDSPQILHTLPLGYATTLGGAYYARPLGQLLALGIALDRDTDFTVTVYLLCNLLWAMAVWAFFGGAISRIAAVAFARGQQIPWSQARDYACQKWLAYFVAPLMPLLGVLLITLVMAVFALLMRIPYVGLMIGGLVWPLWLVGGLLIAILTLGLAACWPLMWATISCEGTDSFDALGRGFGYLFGKPLRYLFYAVVSLGLGVLGWMVVGLFANTVVECTAWAVSWGSSNAVLNSVTGAEFEYADAWGADLIMFFSGCVTMLPVAFAGSYFWTSATAVYLLLRRDEDQTDMDEVYVDEQDESYGLPPLSSDDAAKVENPVAQKSDSDET